MSTTTRTPDAREYVVDGMTCAHCVLSVREEVGEIDGVQSVDVDLPSGRVTVHGPVVDDEAVRVAVAEAGYELAVPPDARQP
jgi:copper chaperone CopZ